MPTIAETLKQRIAEMKEQQQREELAQDIAGEVKLLSNSGELYFRISAVDCSNVAEYVANNVTLRNGGFRDTIRQLMRAGF